MSIKITIEGATPQELVSNLAEIILRNWQWGNDEEQPTSIEQRALAAVEKQLDKQVAAGVEKAVSEYTTERARSVVEATLAEGIKRTNSYGSTQRVQPWKEFVTEQLVSDQYDRNKIEKLARETVESLFKNQLKGLLDDIVKQVRAQVDELVGQKIKAAVRGAVGVKE